MSKAYVLTHGASNPDYGLESDGVRVFSSRDKARKVLAEMLEHDKKDMTDKYFVGEYRGGTLLRHLLKE